MGIDLQDEILIRARWRMVSTGELHPERRDGALSVADVRDVALRFLRAFWAGDVDAAVELCAPDAKFIFARSLPYPRESPIRAALDAIVTGLFAAFDPPGQFEIAIRHVLVAGEQVTVEYSASGKLANGRAYENDYVMALTLRNGKIIEQRAYTDTLHLSRLFGP